ARTIQELAAEIATLKRLEDLAAELRRSGEDRKWRELAALLGEIFTRAALADEVAEDDGEGRPALPKPQASPRQKLVVFTEHRDTLSYLEKRIRTLLGRPSAVVVIHGG